MELLCYQQPDVGHPVANCHQQGHPGGSAPRGPSPRTLPVTQTRLLGNGEEGSDQRTGWGVRERGAYSLWSPHALAHWCHG